MWSLRTVPSSEADGDSFGRKRNTPWDVAGVSWSPVSMPKREKLEGLDSESQLLYNESDDSVRVDGSPLTENLIPDNIHEHHAQDEHNLRNTENDEAANGLEKVEQDVEKQILTNYLASPYGNDVDEIGSQTTRDIKLSCRELEISLSSLTVGKESDRDQNHEHSRGCIFENDSESVLSKMVKELTISPNIGTSNDGSESKSIENCQQVCLSLTVDSKNELSEQSADDACKFGTLERLDANITAKMPGACNKFLDPDFVECGSPICELSCIDVKVAEQEKGKSLSANINSERCSDSSINRSDVDQGNDINTDFIALNNSNEVGEELFPTFHPGMDSALVANPGDDILEKDVTTELFQALHDTPTQLNERGRETLIGKKQISFADEHGNDLFSFDFKTNLSMENESEAEDPDTPVLLRTSLQLYKGCQTLKFSPDEVALAINAGGSALQETSFGIGFSEDKYFSGGDVLRTAEDIIDAQESNLYQTARYGDVTYTIRDLPIGEYYVDLHFAEIVFTNGPPGMRVFDVYLQRQKIVTELDVYDQVGSNRPLILSNARASVKDGILTLALRGVIGSPTISAICIHSAPQIGSCLSSIPQKEKNDMLGTLKDLVDGDPIYGRKTSEGKSCHQRIRMKARKCVKDYEVKMSELKNECHQAWTAAEGSYREIEKLRYELQFKSLTADTLANAVEEQLMELRDLRDKEDTDRKTWAASISQMQKEVQKLKETFDLLSRDTKEWIYSFPDSTGMIAAVQALVNEHQDLKKRYQEESQERKTLYNKVIELRGNVRVFCRCRPLSISESANGGISVVDFDSSRQNELTVRQASNSKKHFKFDRVFTPEDDQSNVFADTAPVVTSVLDGYNVCIFAYGQTGTGKTFTMEGTPMNRGVNYRTLEELFRIAGQRKTEVKYEIYVSVLEVYNEQIRDLLSPSVAGQPIKKLEVKQVPEGGQHVPGLEEARVHSMSEVWQVLQTGSAARAVGATNANEHSSRSHCMLCVKVKGEDLASGECTRSKLWLVDLAGSERVAKSDVQGERLKEAQNINKSLSALGDVIHALTTKSNHVPYRNSKLTHLLQDSLGGESKTLMFVQISPNEADVGETLCSLNFASRVRGVELGPARKQMDFTELAKSKQVAEKAKQDGKKLEEALKSMESKLKDKEHAYHNLEEKVKEREKTVAKLELQLEVERKARLSAEASLKEKSLKLAEKHTNETKWEMNNRADAEEALEAAFKSAAAFQGKEREYSKRPPLQEKVLSNESKLPEKSDNTKLTCVDGFQNENVDPQQRIDLAESAALKQLAHGRMKFVASRFNSPPLMKNFTRRSGRASTCGVIRRTSLVPGSIIKNPPATMQKGKVNFATNLESSAVDTVNSVQKERENIFRRLESATIGATLPLQELGAQTLQETTPMNWKGTLARFRAHRRVHFSSPLLRSRERLEDSKRKEMVGEHGGGEAKPPTSRMRRVSLVSRSWSRQPGGAVIGPQRVLSNRNSSKMHQRERAWNKC